MEGNTQSRRRRLFSVFIALLVFTGFQAFAYQSGGSTPVDKGNTSIAITMNVITHKGVNYVNWTVKGQEVHDVFFVQRSIDESEFETVDFVLGLGVNPSLVLGYSYIDESPPLGSIRYRIKIIGKDQMVLHSKFVAVIVKVPARNPLAHTLIFP